MKNTDTMIVETKGFCEIVENQPKEKDINSYRRKAVELTRKTGKEHGFIYKVPPASYSKMPDPIPKNWKDAEGKNLTQTLPIKVKQLILRRVNGIMIRTNINEASRTKEERKIKKEDKEAFQTELIELDRLQTIVAEANQNTNSKYKEETKPITRACF